MPDPQPEKERSENGLSLAGLRFSSVLTFLFLALAAIVVAYIVGVMVGRSEIREEPTETEHVALAEKPPAIPVEKPAHDILQPQDLDYARVLRNEKARERIRDNHPKQQPANVASSDSTAESGKSESDASPTKETNIEPVAEPTVEKQAQSAMSDYVFQLGAFKDEDTVDALRQKLEGRGLRTRMRKEGKLYLVLVLLRGTPERANEVAAIARELRLGDPIIRSKKAVPEYAQ